MIPLPQSVAIEAEPLVTEQLIRQTDEEAEEARPEQVADQSFFSPELKLLYRVQGKVQEAAEGKEVYLSLAEFTVLTRITG